MHLFSFCCGCVCLVCFVKQFLLFASEGHRTDTACLKLDENLPLFLFLNASCKSYSLIVLDRVFLEALESNITDD